MCPLPSSTFKTWDHDLLSNQFFFSIDNSRSENSVERELLGIAIRTRFQCVCGGAGRGIACIYLVPSLRLSLPLSVSLFHLSFFMSVILLKTKSIVYCLDNEV